MKIVRAIVDWMDHCDNRPEIKVFVDEDPFGMLKGMKNKVIVVEAEGPHLSSQQMQAVNAGLPPRKPGKGKPTTVVVGETDLGFVRWVVDDPKMSGGSGAGTYELEDGSHYEVTSGWFTGPDILHKAGYPQILDVGVYKEVPEGERRPVGLGAVGVYLSAIEPFLPDNVVVEPDGLIHWRDTMTKAEWRTKESKRIAPLREKMEKKYGIHKSQTRAESGARTMDWGKEHRLREEMMQDPDWPSYPESIRPYAELEPA